MCPSTSSKQEKCDAWSRVAEIVRGHGGPPPKSLDLDENSKPKPYMQKTCDVAEKAILAKKNLRKKCVNRDKSA